MPKIPEYIFENKSVLRSEGTNCDLLLKEGLASRGLLFEENPNDVYGKPSIVFTGKKIAIFCDGEFWHGCNWEKTKERARFNHEFLINKIDDDLHRDAEVNKRLTDAGWIVLRFWEKEILYSLDSCLDYIEKIFHSGSIKYSSIDLFAGIGGIRKGFENAFGDTLNTVFVSELDPYARKTYSSNFKSPKNIDTDITAVDTNSIPHFDICLAGFPCQAFSQAGNKNGFQDDHFGVCRGTLFFDVAKICEARRPKVIFCENVKGLLSNDKGRTISIILSVLEELGYNPHITVLNVLSTPFKN